MIYTPERTCAFTGHRPEKLPWGYYEGDERCQALKERMWKAAQDIYDMGYRHFLCGMAQGCDLYFAETILALRCLAVGVTLEAVIPHAGQADRWSADSRERYERILGMCDKRTTLAQRYTSGCMQRRNRYMVDHSAAILAVCCKGRSGSMQTYHYAEKQQLARCRICLEQPRQPVGWEVERYSF